MSTGTLSAGAQLSGETVVRGRLPLWASIAFTFGAALLWALSLREIDVSRMNDLGLISVLPPQVSVALLVLTVAFCLMIRQTPLRVPVILLELIVLVFILYGTVILVEEVPRFSSTWRHIGVTEAIMRTGHVDPKIDAYFNWPGFFTLNALVTEVAGFKSALSFAAWAPVFFNLLYLGPLLMICGSATEDKRVPWLGVWFFYLGNWIGQDYLAPQALNYFLFLVIIGILLKWFKVTSTPRASGVGFRGLWPPWRIMGKITEWLKPTDIQNAPSNPTQRAGLIAIVVTLFIVVVSGHQLTPFAALACVIALVLFERCTVRGLPILMAVIIATWISYMAVSYLAGHLSTLTSYMGEVSGAVGANVTSRLQGSPEHVFVVTMRLVMTIAVWALALLGGLRSWRNGNRYLTYALLGGATFPLLILQPYGGEMLLRVYIFALPFVAFFIATLFFTLPTYGRSWRATFLIGILSIGLLGGFFFTRYGNERMDYFTQYEVDAIQYLYTVAEPGSLWAVGTPALPWKFENYEKYKYTKVMEDVWVGDVDHIATLMAQERYTNAYLVLTRSQQAHAELFYSLPSGTWDNFLKSLVDSGKFELIYSNFHADIFTLVDQTQGANP